MGDTPLLKVDDMESWASVFDTEESIRSKSRFSISFSLTSKIFLCQNNIDEVKLDAVVIPVNQVVANLPSCTTLSTPQLIHDCRAISRDMKTGSVKLDSGQDLSCCRFVIHAMEPKYFTFKYKTAIETAVHSCYRSALDLAKEQHLSTIAFLPLYTFDDEQMAYHLTHVALRTIRCYMEKFPTNFKAVLLYPGQQNMSLYRSLLSVYFPRTSSEMEESDKIVSQYAWDEWGASTYHDRNIRITSLLDAPCADATISDDDGDDSTTATTIAPMYEKNVRNLSFFNMSGDHDRKRRWQLKMMDESKKKRSQLRVYNRLLRCSRIEDLSSISARKALYLCGNDRDGCPIAVMVGRFIDAATLSLDKALLYLIHLMDPVVSKNYSIIYFHTQTTKANRLPKDFLLRVYQTVDARYRDNLKKIYFVHSTIWSKVYSWFFANINTSPLKDRLAFVESIPQLYQHISSDEIDIPPFVINYDMKTNPNVYRRLKSSQEARTQQQQQCSKEEL